MKPLNTPGGGPRSGRRASLDTPGGGPRSGRRASLVLTLALAGTAVVAAAEQGKLRALPPEAVAVEGQWIVVLDESALGGAAGREGASAARLATEMASAHQGAVLHSYEHAIKGFAVRMSEQEARLLADDARVKFVEPDSLMHIVGSQPSPPSYGLDRIDQRDLALSAAYDFNFDGTGVHAYIIDTGIRVTHQDFGGRAQGDFTAVDDGNGTNDCNGHGTHVSGTVGGATFGVAKNVTLHAVRVLGCSGSSPTSGVIAGVDFVTANHQSPAVANMSLGGGISQALDDAVSASIASGVVYAVAAGNNNADACSFSPSRTPAALTVGSTTSNDTRSSFSNFGTCVDLFAPGSNITSAWATSDTATNTISGTSMATPHVVGVAALVRQEHPEFTPAQVAEAILGNASGGRVLSAGTGSPNRLLFSIFGVPLPALPATGDFDRDGRSDIVWHNQATGQLAAWHMDDASLVSASVLGTMADTNWKPVGTADLNRDGSNDVLWWNQATGALMTWFMHGTSLYSSSSLTPALSVPDTNWRVVGTGDFNGDGRPDILWRHQTAGTLAAWFMDGNVRLSAQLLSPSAVADTSWAIEAVGDFNHDGKPDLMWRHQAAGVLFVLFMDGTTATGAQVVSPTVADTSWGVVGAADYNRDLETDLLWWNRATGQVALWHMNGAILASVAPTNPAQVADLSWRVVGPR